ncbi:SHS2 domain inserted in FtsA [Acididesulfobacillus acetoxydans]|uniref:Actin-like ATPase involved in cell division n=1 Tax=Acididesulfobacillus acetoxydans TaxID=1561005 RepID=A0A8S0XWT7_9FIRM|nr:ATPase [Acididesulfobacillus acetoxydans]CAA7601257.1 SHS2 domain inserted in FtsA [Acididesulfobacillus acetoxydans]CEJ08464.1 Actin-like ATPase involved in cell division [Acididesulfobacillus acetoxydans]
MEPLFALDIGTRVVIGLLIGKEGDDYEILASARTEHRQRAMYDGQVHDVGEVARAVRRVKEELEERTGSCLREVAVAAAGRALCTETAESERREMFPIRWEREDVLALEMEAVQFALRKKGHGEGEGWAPYHCVGYDTVAQWLEGEPIGSLAGQRGKSAKVTVIATFLPRTVVDGLAAVLDRVGLVMGSLTLEPIAAGQVAIPPDMRRLNLALVDVGAGTADIALTKNGAFFAYGMVPMAGDEVTEALCAHYLLDFQTGETVKRQLTQKKSVVFSDFFGRKTRVAGDAVKHSFEPIVAKLAEKISEEIISLNQSLPQAIILIGGGSLTPGLPEHLAEKMGLPPTRVGLRLREHLSHVKGTEVPPGPEGITPIGIGVAAFEGRGLHYYTVSVNGRQVPIFELELATVAEALLAAGVHPAAFLGRPGRALTYEINGEMKVIKGELGRPARILLNGRESRLEETVAAGDAIEFTPGQAGRDAGASVAEIWPDRRSKKIFWQGREEDFAPLLFLNGRPALPAEEVPDGAKFAYFANEDLFSLLRRKGYRPEEGLSLRVRVNGQERRVERPIRVRLNGTEVQENRPLVAGDRVEPAEEEIPLSALELESGTLPFYVNGEAVLYKPPELAVFWRDKRLAPDSVLRDGMDLHTEVPMPILSEVLAQSMVPPQVPPGSRLSLTVNGREAEFTTVLCPGDRVNIVWQRT